MECFTKRFDVRRKTQTCLNLYIINNRTIDMIILNG